MLTSADAAYDMICVLAIAFESDIRPWRYWVGYKNNTGRQADHYLIWRTSCCLWVLSRSANYLYGKTSKSNNSFNAIGACVLGRQSGAELLSLNVLIKYQHDRYRNFLIIRPDHQSSQPHHQGKWVLLTVLTITWSSIALARIVVPQPVPASMRQYVMASICWWWIHMDRILFRMGSVVQRGQKQWWTEGHPINQREIVKSLKSVQHKSWKQSCHRSPRRSLNDPWPQ